MGDKTVIGVSSKVIENTFTPGLRQVFPAPMSTIAEEMAETLGLRYYSGQVLWWLRQRNGSLIVVGEGRGGGGKLLSFYKQQTLLRSGLERKSPSECILSSLTTFVVFLLSTARIIRLKHDSIGKLNLNFVFKVPQIMQN